MSFTVQSPRVMETETVNVKGIPDCVSLRKPEGNEEPSVG